MTFSLTFRYKIGDEFTVRREDYVQSINIRQEQIECGTLNILEVAKKGGISRKLYSAVALESIKMDLVTEQEDITPTFYCDDERR